VSDRRKGEQTRVTASTLRVAVIGAGPSGLAQLCAFAAARDAGAVLPEIVCFEKQDDWGGQWRYTWRTGLDQHGEPVHGGMYRRLWSNGPKECLELADYSFDEHFGQPTPSYAPREALHDYLSGRAKARGVRPWIRFQTTVRHVAYDPSSDRFSVLSEHLPARAQHREYFDYVVVAAGHFSTPNIPHFEGVETFPGRVLHGHDFRSAEEFRGGDVVVVGGKYSAEDIALQCHKYGAKSVTISYRTRPMGFRWPDGVRETPLVSRIDGRTVHFEDGASQEADALILCTGYLYHFPFLADDLRLVTGNRFYPAKLYKGVCWLDNPKVMYLGMQDQLFTFSMFDAQAWYVRDLIVGGIQLPDRAAMAADIDRWTVREEALEDLPQHIDFQADYTRDLCEATDYPKLDLGLCAEHFKTWVQDRELDITCYRDKAFKSPVTGTAATVPKTPWAEALDDSLAGFLGRKR
jgi:trimethylamine monooxygenase